MTKEQAIDYLYRNEDYLFLDEKSKELLVEALCVSSSLEAEIEDFPFKNPKTVHTISLFVGMLGIDRFYLHDYTKAIIKYFTLGGLGIWWILDIKNAYKNCKKANNILLLRHIGEPSFIQKTKEKAERNNRLKKAVEDLVREFFNKKV